MSQISGSCFPQFDVDDMEIADWSNFKALSITYWAILGKVCL